MAKEYKEQFKVENSKRTGHYIVSKTFDIPAKWECSCVGWTRHVPRKDCKHISLANVKRLHKSLKQPLSLKRMKY